MNWIYDKYTDHSRLMVGYDRYGITVRQWSDDHECDEGRFNFQEGFFAWGETRKRAAEYSGKLKDRLVRGACDMLAYHGGSSDSQGFVDSLFEYVDCGHIRNC